MPYTALKAENSISERNAGDLESRAKTDNLCSSMPKRYCFSYKISCFEALTSLQNGWKHKRFMQSVKKATIRLSGGYCS